MIKANMYKYGIFLALIIIGTVLSSCLAKKEIIRSGNYSFFVGGHVYGSPKGNTLGVYPPFLKKIMENSDRYNFGFFTGDIVRESTKESWLRVQDDLKKIKKPIYFAPGNHDMGDRTLYQEMNRITDTFFVVDRDVFLLFDNTKYGWNMDSLQTVLFRKALSHLSNKSRLFVFGHNVLWQDKYTCARSNSLAGKGTVNLFWTAIFPKLKELKNEVYWFAGDVGAKKEISNVTYVNEANIHLITSGMGNKVFDNHLQVNVTEKMVNINVIPLDSSVAHPISHYQCK